MSNHARITIALVLGFGLGLLLQRLVGAEDPTLTWSNKNLFEPAGTIFLNLIFMVVVPLLFSALVLGVAEIGAARKLGRIGAASLGMTVLLSGIAVAVGLIAVNVARPGGHVTPEERTRLMAAYGSAEKVADVRKKVGEAKSAADTIAELVPRSPLQAAVEGNLLPFMVFALIFGIALSAVEPERALPVSNFLDGIFAACLHVISMAMRFAPIGVFALTFRAGSTLGLSAITAMGAYVAVVLVALAFHQFVVYSAVIRWIAGRSPIEFFRQIREVMLTAFTTSSSNATLPTALRVSEENVGVPRDVGNFVLTVGATANQNGTALFEGVTILFLAQFFGITLDLSQQLAVMAMAILAGVGTAGVPGGSWPMIGAIMVKVGIPLEGVGICMGIDRILDMSRTVLNVSGDMTIAACVARISGMKPALES